MLGLSIPAMSETMIDKADTLSEQELENEINALNTQLDDAADNAAKLQILWSAYLKDSFPAVMTRDDHNKLMAAIRTAKDQAKAKNLKIKNIGEHHEFVRIERNAKTTKPTTAQSAAPILAASSHKEPIIPATIPTSTDNPGFTIKDEDLASFQKIYKKFMDPKDLAGPVIISPETIKKYIDALKESSLASNKNMLNKYINKLSKLSEGISKTTTTYYFVPPSKAIAVTSKTPVIVSKIPVIVSKEAVSVSKIPVIVSKEAVSVSKIPVIVSKEAVSVSKIPVIVSKEAVSVSKIPVIVSKEAVSVSKIPDAVHSRALVVVPSKVEPTTPSVVPSGTPTIPAVLNKKQEAHTVHLSTNPYKHSIQNTKNAMRVMDLSKSMNSLGD